MGAGRGALRRLSDEPVTMSRGMERSPAAKNALLWNHVAGCVPAEDHDGVRRGRTGFRWPPRTVHDHRHLLGLCTSRCRLECRCIAGRAGPVGLVEHRPRRPEAAHSLSSDRAAGITRPIESALTLMPPGMLRGPEAAAARSARCTWVCVDVHTECASHETHLKGNVSRRLRRSVANCEQPTEQPTHWAITDPCTRPRTRPRSAITRRTPRLRLVMRRSGVRFPEAAPGRYP
jgi:hypothetical protein